MVSFSELVLGGVKGSVANIRATGLQFESLEYVASTPCNATTTRRRRSIG